MIKKGYIIVFLLLIVIFYAVNNYFIVRDNLTIPVHPDEAAQLINSLVCYKILVNPSSQMFMQWDNTHPPLFPFSAAILYLFFRTSRIVSVMTNTVYFLIMLFSVYFIGKKIKDKNTGLLACFILSMFPMIFGMSRWFMLDFALTAMVCFSIYCLLYSENFTNRKYSLLFGLSLGLGMLIKWTFAFFIFGPFIHVLLNKEKKNIPNLFYSITIGLLISIKWYQGFFMGIKSIGWSANFYICNTRPGEIHFLWNSLDGLLFYLRSIFFYEISPFFLILLLLTFVFFIKAKVKNKAILVAWILYPYTILTLINNKQSHYITSSLPVLALILAIGILSVPFRRMRYSLICLVIMGGYIQFFYVSYLGYQHIEKLINHSLINLRLMRYPISFQNMWNYTDSIPYDSYNKLSRVITDEIIPYIKEASSEKENFIIGIIDLRYHSLDLAIKYFSLRDSWGENILVLDSWRNPLEFLSAINEGRLNLLFIIYDIPILDDKYNIEEVFKQNISLAAEKNLDRKDYFRAVVEMYKGLNKSFEVAEVKEINAYSYLLILTKRDKADF